MKHNNTALISPCGAYRYRLGRRWDNVLSMLNGSVLFVMLNPSTADASDDDPTIRRCTAFATRWGFGCLDVGNISAFRATDPRALKGDAGPDNEHHLAALADNAAIIVCAWGRAPRSVAHLVPRALRTLRQANKPLHCLGINSDGSPKHPLYLRSDVAPMPWSTQP